MRSKISRRAVVGGAAAILAAPPLATSTADATPAIEPAASQTTAAASASGGWSAAQIEALNAQTTKWLREDWRALDEGRSWCSGRFTPADWEAFREQMFSRADGSWMEAG